MSFCHCHVSSVYSVFLALCFSKGTADPFEKSPAAAALPTAAHYRPGYSRRGANALAERQLVSSPRRERGGPGRLHIVCLGAPLLGRKGPGLATQHRARGAAGPGLRQKPRTPAGRRRLHGEQSPSDSSSPGRRGLPRGPQLCAGALEERGGDPELSSASPTPGHTRALEFCVRFLVSAEPEVSVLRCEPA